MTWQQIALTTVIILGMLSSISSVGKHREPLTPGIAAWGTIINLILIGLILSM